MKYVFLGIKDYCKDCWHDFWYWFWDRLATFFTRRSMRCYVWRYNEGCYTKEGSVWRYIQQRKVAQLLKEIKRLKKELK